MALSTKNVEHKLDLQFRIQQLRQEKLIWGIQEVVVVLMGVVTAVFLPELVLRVLIARNPALQAQPEFVQYIPSAAFVLSLLFVLWVSANNILRHKEVVRLEQEWSALSK